MRGVVKFRLELDGAVLLVVTEQVLDGVTDHASGGAWAHDNAEEVDGDGPVDPRKDGEVVAPPVRRR